MRIVLDAMGSDTCPEPEIRAAVEASNLYDEEIILVGPEGQLKKRLASYAISTKVRLINAPEVITMEDKGLKLALKAKRPRAQNSMAVGIDLVKTGEADAFVTAGNTGGAMVTAFYRLGIIPGVERPALTALFPVSGGYCVVLDIGANPDCKPVHLYQFAVMGSVYAERVLSIKKPRVGLLSNGEESGKGNQLIRDTYLLLNDNDLNFVGNLEGKELFGGYADVAVTDGFTGNVLLKSSEAVAKLISEILRKELTSTMRTKIGGLLAKPAFNRLKQIMDPGEVGAAPLLGVNGLVYIGHGRSDSHALMNAIRVARQAVEADLLSAIDIAIQDRLTSLSLPRAI